MFSTYKRKILSLILVCVLTLSFITACTGIFAKGDQENLSVNFIDVGLGDSTLVSLPGGKTLLIDTGANTPTNKDKLVNLIKKYSNRIDYLVLTSLVNEHISNAVNVIEEFEIGKAFIPNVLDKTPYLTFNSVYNMLVEREIDIEFSKGFTNLSNTDYTLLFLSPNASGVDGDYAKFNYADTKDQSLIDNLSPIIYLEFRGVRFLLSSRSRSSQEGWVIENYNNGLYSAFSKNGNQVALDNIDFYKLSNYGGSAGNSVKLLSLLKPKNAIISVSGLGGQGYPSTDTLMTLQSVNPNHVLYRTDVDKTVRVEVNNFGKYQIYKGE